MLTKEVCQYCHIHSKYWIGKKQYRWKDYDEALWEIRKEVWCEKVLSNSEFNKRTSVLGKPPENCPYYFEHQINQEREKCEF